MSKCKNSESVRVVVRCRPPSRREGVTGTGFQSILDVDARLGQISIRNPKASPDEPMRVFTFGSVFGWDSRQTDVYEDAVRPLVDSVLRGFNGTILAYGQTGTGKTHTMMGDPSDPDTRGVIPNSFQHIFTHISRTQNQKYLVTSSYLEIYQEEIRDLLRKDSKNLELKENPDCGVYVKNLSSVVTKNVAEMEHVMGIGTQSRSVGFTNVNERSSRSHAVFVITVECSEVGPDGQEHIRVGKLNMVDLAGSERQRKTGAEGRRLREAAKINLSLSALVDGKSPHVPYRDSKLTRLLQDSLGGNAKTVMIATVGPSHKNYEESLSTLRYSSRAMNIKNKPRINEDPKDALLREFQEEIARLKAQLEERGVLAKERRRRSKRLSMEVEMQREKEEDVRRNLTENRKSLMEDLQWDQEAAEKIIEKYKVMESKLLIGGKTIIDHTNEQQKMLEVKRQEIAEQIRREREIQQQMMLQEEEALELKETFSSLQQEVDLKTKKLRRLHNKLQLVRAEMSDVIGEHVVARQQLEETQHELIKELKYKYLLIENFIPPEEKNKIMNRLHFDSEEDQWRLQLVLPESAPVQVRNRPLSAVGYKRPISQYAQMAVVTATGDPCRYRAENVMLLELDMSPPTMFNLKLDGAHLERAFSPRLMQDLSVSVRTRGGASPWVRKSKSWYQSPQAASVTSSSSSATPIPESQSLPPSRRQRPSSAAFLPAGDSVQMSP